jgi:nucleotide-binding universal stress UspA family protein
MNGIRNILVPVDFSEISADAARYASAFGRTFNASVSLLHVAPPVHFDFAMVQPTERRYRQLASHRNETIRGAFERFPRDPGLQVEPARHMAEGDAAEEIVRFAHDQGFDMIVMPTRGCGPIQRWLMIGSVTLKVLHEAECPVLSGVDFANRRDGLRLDHVICAIDLGPQSRKVLCWASGLARLTGSGITILHAIPGAGEAEDDYFDESWRMTLRERARERIASLAAETGAKGDIIVETGDAHKVVAQAARRLRADLITIGRGVSHDLLGRLRAHAYEIIRQSPCPVVSV